MVETSHYSQSLFQRKEITMKVIYLADYKKEKAEDRLIQDVLYPKSRHHLEDDDFAARMRRVKASLEKINQLMKDNK
jgi:hypothetical protein